MKRAIPTAIAAVLFAGLLAFVLWGPTGAKKEEPEQKEHVLDVKREEVKRLEVATPDFTVGVAKEQKQEGDKTVDVWTFAGLQNVEVKPEETVDQSKVDLFLYSCCPLSAKKKVADNATDLEPYGLDKPQWRVRINGEKGFEVGAFNQAAQGYYARPIGSNAIYLIENSLATYLPSKAREWVKEKEKAN